MSAEYWLLTQQELSPLITSPALATKLLQKPPFKFLFDIMTSLMQTGFCKGLYSPGELNRDAYEDKETKLAFFEKLISYVEFCLNEKVTVNPRKILAGAEPEKTNEFLVQIARAAKRGDAVWADALSKMASAPPPPPPPPPPPCPTAAPIGTPFTFWVFTFMVLVVML
eukprot:PhF_6_TR3472/c1_g1_i1/m.5087/K19680/TRAF3IP1, IFT54; TRAF3-interacting protein 1